MKRRSVSYKKKRRRIVLGVFMAVFIAFSVVMALEWGEIYNHESLYNKNEEEIALIKTNLFEENVLDRKFSGETHERCVKYYNSDGDLREFIKIKDTFYRTLERQIPLKSNPNEYRVEKMLLKFEFESPEILKNSDTQIGLKVSVVSKENYWKQKDGLQKLGEGNHLAIDEMILSFETDEEEQVTTYREYFSNEHYKDKMTFHDEPIDLRNVNSHIVYASSFKDSWEDDSKKELKNVGDSYRLVIYLNGGFDRHKTYDLIRHAQMDIYLHVENDTILANYFGKDKDDDFIKFTKKFEYIN